MTIAPLVAVGTYSAAPAYASFIGIKCLGLLGTVTGGVTLQNCTGHTGMFSKSFSATVLADGGKITWVNGKATTIKVTAKNGTKTCPDGLPDIITSGTTTADTTKSAPVGGKVTIQWCLTEQTINQVQGTIPRIG
jgi:hypothetical protein